MTIPDDDTIGLADLCKLLDMSKQGVAELVSKGRVVKVGRGFFKLSSLAVYIKHLREKPGKNRDEDGLKRLAVAELLKAESDAERAKWKAEQDRLKVATMNGQLVDSEAVVMAMTSLTTTVTARLRGLPKRLVGMIRQADSDMEGVRLLKKGIDEALNEISKARIEFDIKIDRHPEFENDD